MTPVQLALEPHPLLDLAAFTATFVQPLRAVDGSSLAGLLTSSAAAPVTTSDTVKTAVRKLLRHGGYKPSGRGKPASEYLRRADEQGTLSRINAAVDACNVVSLHSGLPISVIDLDAARPPFSVAIAAEGQRYVFNLSGQQIDLTGLLCLHDADGPCANAVKDAQRTKTHDDTTRILTVVWGTNALPGHTGATTDWYVELVEGLGATVQRLR